MDVLLPEITKNVSQRRRRQASQLQVHSNLDMMNGLQAKRVSGKAPPDYSRYGRTEHGKSDDESQHELRVKESNTRLSTIIEKPQQ